MDRWSDYQNYKAFGEGQSSNPNYDPGWPEHRAKALIQFLSSKNIIGKGKTYLDFGCHHGQFLEYLEGSHLGLDINDSYRTYVEARGQKYIRSPKELKAESVDAIFMLHVFEHLPSPKKVRTILKALKPGGMVITQVPNPMIQLCDFYVGDHRSHFSAESLIIAHQKIGLFPQISPREVVPGEWTMISTLKDHLPQRNRIIKPLLGKLMSSEKQILNLKSNGEKKVIYGTGYTGLMLAKNFGDQVEAFVDDNLKLQGQSLMGIPISALNHLECSKVILGVPSSANQSVVKKCKANGVEPVLIFDPID